MVTRTTPAAAGQSGPPLPAAPGASVLVHGGRVLLMDDDLHLTRLDLWMEPVELLRLSSR